MRAKFLLLLAACAVAANIRAQMPDNGQPNYDYAFGDNVYNLPELSWCTGTMRQATSIPNSC